MFFGLLMVLGLIRENEDQQADHGVDPEEDGECDFHGVVSYAVNASGSDFDRVRPRASVSRRIAMPRRDSNENAWSLWRARSTWAVVDSM
jgi:hypothetical protein